jgi:hypothetical protein
MQFAVSEPVSGSAKANFRAMSGQVKEEKLCDMDKQGLLPRSFNEQRAFEVFHHIFFSF